jgi:hypothetical protein
MDRTGFEIDATPRGVPRQMPNDVASQAGT